MRKLKEFLKSNWYYLLWITLIIISFTYLYSITEKKTILSTPLYTGLAGLISCGYLIYKKHYKYTWSSLVVSLVMTFITYICYSLDLDNVYFHVWLITLTFTSWLNILTAAEILEFEPDKERNFDKDYCLRVFSICFLVILVSYLTVFYTSGYPGTFEMDNVTQLVQIDTGLYNNHHPFMHTMIMKLCIWLSNGVYQDGIALMSLIQIILFAASLSYVLTLLYKLGMKRRHLVLLVIWCSLSNMMVLFSFNLTKDVFSLIAELFLMGLLLQITNHIGNQKFNYIAFCLCLVWFIEMKSMNVYLVLLVAAIYFIISKATRKFCTIIICMCIASMCIHTLYPNDIKMNYEVLDNYKKTSLSKYEDDYKRTKEYWEARVLDDDILESCGVFIYQIFRVNMNRTYDYLTEDEQGLLNSLITAKMFLLRDTIDELKDDIRRTGNVEVITDNLFTFIKIYIKSFLYNPAGMLKSWIYLVRSYITGPFGVQFGYWDAVYINPYNVNRPHIGWYTWNITSWVSSSWRDYHDKIGVYMILWVVLIYKWLLAPRKGFSYVFVFGLVSYVCLMIACPQDNIFRYIIGYVIPFILIFPLYYTKRTA